MEGTKKKGLREKLTSEQPRVSVIMPVYNVASYLRESMESVVNQTVKDIEIICIDDGSSDSSWEILKKYASKDERIILLKNPRNLGAASTRNIGFQIAVGMYVSFLDSDDIYDFELIEKMYKESERCGADVCICAYDAFYNQCTALRKSLAVNANREYKDGYDVKDRPDRIFQVANLAPQFKMYRRSFLIENDISFQPLKNSNDVFLVWYP